VQTQDRFKNYDAIHYQVLDISQDPLEQGFRAADYDLVVASNVPHATPFLNETLKNYQKLLRDDGYLFLQEISPITKSANFVMGLFSGWWLAADDGRIEEPFISPEEWNTRLVASGFNEISTMVWDGEPPHRFNASIFVRPAATHHQPVPQATRIALLTRTKDLGKTAKAAKRLLTEQAHEVDHCACGDEVHPESQCVISFTDWSAAAKAHCSEM
jgi:SAM-dependent methyltransferase